MPSTRRLAALLFAAALAAPGMVLCDAMAMTLGPCPGMTEGPASGASGCHPEAPEPAMSCCFADGDVVPVTSALPAPSLPIGAAPTAQTTVPAPRLAGTCAAPSRQPPDRERYTLFSSLLL